MTLSTYNYEVIQRIVCSIFINMMNIKLSFSCFANRTLMFKFIKCKSSIRPFSILIKNTIRSKILSFSKFIHAFFRTKFSIFSIWHNFKSFITCKTDNIKPFLRKSYFSLLSSCNISTAQRAIFSKAMTWQSKKLISTMITN